jgi:hypothetical protein
MMVFPTATGLPFGSQLSVVGCLRVGVGARIREDRFSNLFCRKVFAVARNVTDN